MIGVLDVHIPQALNVLGGNLIGPPENSSQPTPSDDPRPIVTFKSSCNHEAFIFFQSHPGTLKWP
jgi:hypothetical protein